MDSILHDLKLNSYAIIYEDVCRHFCNKPLEFLKPTNNETVLEFVGDDLNVDEWIPVIVALRYDNSLHTVSIKSKYSIYRFLHNVDTLQMARYRGFASMRTRYVFSRLIESMAVLLINSKVLTVLELTSLPMFFEYSKRLVNALKKNETLKHISFVNCDIKDEGCKLICEYLQSKPNVETINLSGCQLTSNSGEYITRLIKIQQICRYCDSWPSSNYEDLLKKGMDGIKQIILNNNTDFKDKGLDYLLITLEHDKWLETLYLQNCGITEELSDKILKTIYFNNSLRDVNLNNNLLSYETIDNVQLFLRRKRRMKFVPEFKRCNQGSTLASTSTDTFTSNSFSTPPIYETFTSAQEVDLNSNGTQFKITEEQLHGIINDKSNQETPTLISPNRDGNSD